MLNFKTSLISGDGNHGVFSLEPLESGFGHTLGSVLRRVLLSSLEGAAITSAKISGVSHQFSTIPGMSEDVIELILNLKKIRVKLFSDKAVKFTLQANGKGEVTARQIDTGGLGEVVNPDLHIAALNDPKAKLHMDLTVEKGVGYAEASDNKSNEIGSLGVDALFSPVLKVNYSVEPTRVGRRSDFDKLILEVTTDGTTKPEDALYSSARLLSGYFKQMYDPTLDEAVVTETPTISDDMLKMSVEELDLPVRITNALKAIDIDTVSALISTPKSTLMKAKNLGAKSLSLISEKLTERNLSLSEA